MGKGAHSYYTLLPFTGFDAIHVYISYLRCLGRTRSYNWSKFSVIWKMLWDLSNGLAEIIVPNNILFKIRNHLLQIEQNFCFDKFLKTFVRLAYTNTCFYKYNSFFYEAIQHCCLDEYLKVDQWVQYCFLEKQILYLA